MINVTRDESLHRIRAFWEIFGNLSADDHSFMLSEKISLPTKGTLRDILPNSAFVIGILVNPFPSVKYGSNATLATNFSDTLGKKRKLWNVAFRHFTRVSTLLAFPGLQDIWETIETDVNKPLTNRATYRKQAFDRLGVNSFV